MTTKEAATVIPLGIAGAVLGGFAGYFAFFWLAHHGLYALVLPGALPGLGAALCARRGSVVLAVICGTGGLALATYTEWRFEPFITDARFGYFIRHVISLQPITIVMLIIGAVLSFSFAFGFERTPRI